MEISSYELVEFLNTLPKTGLVEFTLTDETSIYAVSGSARYESVGESNLRITGRTGFSLMTFDDSTVLIDAERIVYIRHGSETPR